MDVGALIGGRFDVERKAGSGAMGVVYQARDRSDGRLVALKVLTSSGTDSVRRFEQEVRLISALRHPAIVSYVTHGVMSDGGPYLVMEWVEGEDLAVRLRRGCLTLDEMSVLAERVLAGLAAAHEIGVAHRDLKPANILLEGGLVGRSKLADFGLAKVATVCTSLTQTGTILGTPAYMAPEQARGDPVDGRTDMFALGSVLYECVTGQLAFDGSDPISVLTRIVFDDVSVRELPRRVAPFIARLLAKDPKARPPDANAAIAELRALSSAGSGDGDQPLSLSEKNVAAIVLVASDFAFEADANASTVLVAAAPQNAKLQNLAAEHGARVEQLLDGSVVAVVADASAPTDLAARAALLSLQLREVFPTHPIVLAIGRTVGAGSHPIGPAVEEATRLWRDEARRTAATPAGVRPIRLNETTRDLLDARFHLRGSGPALWLRGVRTGVDPVRRLLGRTSPFVARERELRTLDALYDACATDSTAQLVLLTGPPGLGKSRLRAEWLRALWGRGEDVTLWIARAEPMTTGSPYAMLLHALRHHTGIEIGMSTERVQRSLRRFVASRIAGDEAGRVTAFLAELVGAPLAAEDNQFLRAARADPRLMSEQLARAWLDLFAADCKVSPTILVLEDLHWGDEPTVALVGMMARELREQRLFVLALSRPEVESRFPELWAGGITRVALSPLSVRASEELGHALLGRDADAELVTRVVDRAAGNPFFLEELARYAQTGERETPDSVLLMLQCELEALPAESRRLLRAASVFGEVVMEDGLATLVEGTTSTERLSELLDELVQGDWIQRRRTGGELTFRHSLVREAAYAMLTEADRRRGHQRAAAWLATRSDTDPLVLAEHYERGDMRDRAGPWWRAAAERALSGGDIGAAENYIQRAIECGAAGEELGELELLQATLWDWRGHYKRSEMAAISALSRLPRGGSAWCRAAGVLARVVMNHGNTVVLKRLGRELIDIATVGSPSVEQAIAMVIVVYMLRMAGTRGDDDTLLELLETRGSADALSDPTVQGYLALCSTVLAQDNIAADLAARRRATEFFAKAGNTIRSHLEMYNCYFDLVELGSYEEALRGLAQLSDWATNRNISSLALLSRGLMAEALSCMGRSSEAVPIMIEVIDNLRKTGSPRKEGSTYVALARAHQRLGNLPEAEACARRGAALAKESAQPHHPTALAVLAGILLAGGCAPEALVVARQAVEEAKTIEGIESGLATISLALAEALWATGAHEEARVVIADSRQRICSVAEQLSEVALRDSYLQSVEDNRRTLALAAEWLDRVTG